MHRHVLGIVGIGLLALGVFGLLSKSKPPPASADILGKVGDFQFTERSGRTISREDLAGKIWVASFIFTCCTQSCPQIAGTMAELQKEFADNDDVVLVSFSVDPKRDTPQVLQEFANRFGADNERWLFLTGDQDKMYSFIRETFLLAVHENEGNARTPGNEVTHSSKLVLVDRHGQIRGYFDGRRVDEEGRPINNVNKIKAKVAELLEEQP
ncbi:MAG: hypothetical protein KatS3mg105_2583 [Gemmatales bacterium]|nr:MAG: hypothetical protein KatS3mg105_2583 [Gemmatales bacterium]